MHPHPQDKATHLALLLQEGYGRDPRILQTFIQEYAVRVQRLAHALTDDPQTARTHTFTAFAAALANVESLRGEPSLETWLYGLLIKTMPRGPRPAAPQLPSAPPAPGGESGGQAARQLDNRLAALRPKYRLPILLRHLCGVSLPDLAHILHTREATLRKRLRQGEAKLLPANSQPVPHIAERLQTRYPLPAPSPAEIARMSQNVLAQPPQAAPRRNLELGWIGLLILVIVAFGAAYLRFSPQQGKPIYFPTPSPLPTPIPMPLGTPLAAPQEQLAYENQFPQISSSGRWVTFVSSAPLVAGDTNDESDVFVYDQETQAFDRVSVASNGAEANGLSFAPSISADGRWVTFLSLADNLVPGDTAMCEEGIGRGFNCIDIFIHDRQTGTTERISAGAGDLPADNHSFFPTISADGHWVAYWSLASNLIPGSAAVCPETTPPHCMNLYLYDRLNRTTRLIPVGRPAEEWLNSTAPALSADGRWLVFGALQTDAIVQTLVSNNMPSVLLYDREMDTVELASVTHNGSPVNGASFTPSISANGRYIGFTSQASNLVPSDTNRRLDVFVYDRAAGTTERVSVASDGTEGDDNSGALAANSPSTHIGLSEDSRWVTFISMSGNLAAETAFCNTTYICVHIYIHDRQTGRTTAVTRPSDNYFLFPSITADGRWLAYTEQMADCALLCSEVWLHDTKTGTAQALLTEIVFGLKEDAPEWTYQNTLNRHQGWVNAVAFSPDGLLLATVANDTEARLWEPASNSLRRRLRGEHTKAVTSVAFSPDGTLLATGSFDGRVNIWRTANYTLLHKLADQPGLVFSVAFSPDGTLLAAGTSEGIYLWSVEGETVQWVDWLAGNKVRGMAFSPDGALLAATDRDNSIRIHRVSDGAVLLRLSGHTREPRALAFSLAPAAEGGQALLLASGGEDDRVNIWRLTGDAGGELHAAFLHAYAHPDMVTAVDFSPNGNFLASVSLDGSVQLWDTRHQDALYSLYQAYERVFSVAFSPDGNTLAFGGMFGQIYLLARTDDGAR